MTIVSPRWPGRLLALVLLWTPAAVLGADVPDAWLRGTVPVARYASELAGERARGGYQDMVPAAEALLEGSRSAPDRERAFDLALLATEAAPDHPPARGRLALLALRSGRIGLAAAEFWAWARALAADPWVRALSLFRAAAVGWLALGLASLALLAAALAAHGRPFAHDYADAFPRALRRFTPAAFALAIFAGLLGAGVGPVLVAAVPALAVATYLPVLSRWVSVAFLALFALLFPSLRLLSLPSTPAGERAWALYRVHKGDAGRELDATLQALFPPDDPAALQARAALARREGDYPRAVALLTAGLKAGADPGAAVLELGNLFFLERRWSEALTRYTEAATRRPEDPVPWMNLHRVRLKRLELAEADAALARAEAIDADAVARSHRRASEGGGDLLPEVGEVSWKPFWAALFGASAEPAWLGALWSRLFGPGRVPAAAVAAALAAAGWLFGLGGAARRSRRCASCGHVVCPRCSRRVKGSPLCPGCWSLGAHKTGDSTERERQEREAARWRRHWALRRAVARVLLPGWADLAFSGGPRHVVAGALWAVTAAAVLLHLVYPAPVLPWSRGAFPAVALGVWGAVEFWAVRGAVATLRAERRR